MDLSRASSLLVFLFFQSFVHGNTDRDALLAFRSKISNDPLGVFSSWNESTTHICNWTGVTCGRKHHNRVTKLDLHSQQLEGTLSPHIGNLSFLRELRLQNNSFTLEIPQELGALFRLELLSLENNSLSGEIPANLSRCSNLYYLSLDGNDLGGELPSELGFLSKLQILRLFNNKFVGNIPSSFGNLSSLTGISLAANSLHGSIPSTFGQLKNLELVIFSGCNLSGPIPRSFFNLSSLYFLALPLNEFSGSLPPDIGFTLPKLSTLLLSSNRFTGVIPISISNLTFLRQFQIISNGFIGKVPYFPNSPYLQELDFALNDLGNGGNDDLNFMSSLLNCTDLQRLVLQNNQFGGMMPEYLSNFSKQIRWMDFGQNQIQGRIPSEIGNLFNLEHLSMERNLLTGSISSSVGKLHNMYGLYLSGNNFFGQIPSSIENLTSLSELDLSRNKLQGSIPPNIGECISLQFTYLSHNNLSGVIPKELFSITSSIHLDLSENILSGLLPSDMDELVNLGYLNVSENKLSGEIPQTLASCKSLETLSMGGNSFHGKLPSFLGYLRGLQYLDFSRNNLSGQVPNYFVNFDLLYLNLSWNDFDGQLPDQGVFSNMSAFSATGNKKLCGGIPELHLPSCTPRKSKLSKGKLIISSVSVIVGMMLVSFLIYKLREKKKLSTESDFSIATSIPKVSYDDLLKATDGFSSANLIGVGGFGSVYKGILGQERSLVAVKVLNLARKGATKSFMAECEALRSLRHRNLVKIITACSSVDFKGNDFKALVYEFMINGNLDDWLHPTTIINESGESKYLSFVQRLNIVVDVALALDYMHNECETPVVHCDLKPSNILIDEDMSARVGDFGLARLCHIESTHQFSSTQSSSIGIKGSIGYAAPEYGTGSEASTYGDVYSFGILLLEVFMGKRPTDNMFQEGLDLHKYVTMALPERVMFILDPIQFQRDDQYRTDKFWDCIIAIFKLGVACSVESPRERTNIKKAAEELVHIRNNLFHTG